MIIHHRVAHAGMLAIALVLAACGGQEKARDAPAAPLPGAAAAPVTGPAGVLRELQNGDRACYVVIDTGADEQNLEGDFDLCAGGDRDASALIGKRITWTTKKAKVLAASCEGNMDCGKSDEVDLVVTISAAH